jgi:uncharacterized membrane protein
MKTVGLSPKALAATGAVLAVGLILVIVGALIPDPDLKQWGYGAIVAAIPALIGAAAASPGTVIRKGPHPKL